MSYSTSGVPSRKPLASSVYRNHSALPVRFWRYRGCQNLANCAFDASARARLPSGAGKELQLGSRDMWAAKRWIGVRRPVSARACAGLAAIASLMFSATSAAGQATTDSLCRDLRLVVAAASDQPRPFASLSNATRPFAADFSHCATTQAGYRCWQTLAPNTLTAREFAARVGACLGFTPTGTGSAQVLVLPGAQLRIHERGTERGQAGRTVELLVQPRNEAAEADGPAIQGASDSPVPETSGPGPAPMIPRPPVPPQSACPAVVNVDLPRLRRSSAEATGRSDDLDVVVVPADAMRRPPPNASIVIRTRLRPSGSHPQDERAVVWREIDGSWWGWRRVVGGPPASPLPPAAPGTPEASQEAADRAAGYPPQYEAYPPSEGRLGEEQAAAMEAAYGDPCRQLEPDVWPSVIPLLSREIGSRVQNCDDSPRWHSGNMAYIAEFTEPGRPARRIGLRCSGTGTLNATLITRAAHVALPRARSRRLSREEIDSRRQWMECWQLNPTDVDATCGPHPDWR